MLKRWRLGALALALGGLTAWVVSPELRLLLVFPLVAFAPGALIEYVLAPATASRPFLIRLALWPAFSIAAVALLFLWAAVLQVAFIPAILRAMVFLIAAWCVYVVIRRNSFAFRANVPFLLASMVCAGAIIQTRFAHIASLALPSWVDSLHHALLIRVAAEQGHAPFDLTPYLPVHQLTYHSGYHSFSAAMLVIAGMTLPDALPQSILIHGQLFGVLAALTAAGWAQYVWRHWIAALSTLVVVGVVSIMPAYYVSWGRYTLLTGVVMLPAALILLSEVAQRPSWRSISAAALVLAGLSLVHFVIFVYALAWAAVLIAESMVRLGMRRAGVLAGLSLSIIGALLVQAPWLALLAVRALPGTGVSAMHLAGNDSYNAMPYALLWASNNALLAGLAGCGALLALAARRRAVVIIVGWSFVIVMASNLPALGLPYISFLTNEILAVTMFLPVAALIGGGASLLAQRFAIDETHDIAGWKAWIAAGLIAAGAVWSAAQFQSVLRADTVIGTADDRAAVEWAREHTPPDARFVVNTTSWLADVDRGADGGWWLLPLAGRQVSTPPVVYTYADERDVARIKSETAWLRDGGDRSAADVAAFMHEHGYTFAYATVNGAPLQRDRLQQSGLFTLRYHNNTVSIFELKP